MTEAGLDIVLHYSRAGESFSYGIAEPMNLGKPAIVNLAPWENMGPLEAVRHRECGFAVAGVNSMTRAIVALASDEKMRRQMGERARSHIRQLTDPDVSTDRLDSALRAVVEGRDNPLAEEDVHLDRNGGLPSAGTSLAILCLNNWHSAVLLPRAFQ